VKVSTCRSCQAPVIWAVTARGKRIPMDAGPREDGGFVLRGQRADDPPLALAKGESRGREPRYVSHFATCPQADEHRVSATSARPQ